MDLALSRIGNLIPQFISEMMEYRRNDSYICDCIKEAEVARERVTEGFRWLDIYKIAATDVYETIYDLFSQSHAPEEFFEGIRSFESSDPSHIIHVLSRVYDKKHYRLVVDPLADKPCAADLLFYEDRMLFNLDID